MLLDHPSAGLLIIFKEIDLVIKPLLTAQEKERSKKMLAGSVSPTRDSDDSLMDHVVHSETGNECALEEQSSDSVHPENDDLNARFPARLDQIAALEKLADASRVGTMFIILY